MKTILTLLMALSAAPALCLDIPCEKKDLERRRALLLPDAQMLRGSCADDDCVITFTPKPGRAADPAALAGSGDAVKAELTGIEAKLDDGTATVADLRRAIKLLLKLQGAAKTP